IVGCAQAARARLSGMAQAMGLHVAPGAPARRLLQDTVAPPTAVAAAGDDRTLVVPKSGKPAATGDQVAAAEAQAGRVACLSEGLEAVKLAVSQRKLRLNEVLNLVLETLHQALDLRSVVFCLRDPRSGLLLGRVALGKGSSDISSAFRIAPDASASTDLFAALCAKGADLLIADSKSVANRLPPWYRQRVNAASFLLLPMMVKGQPIGLIYADKLEAGTLKVGEADLALVRGLRDQAVAAFARGNT
ncbi:MAG: GAF domain-containing protein, partial [Rubrivivax sp.]|nr:GAF domain-containing protein [Rubrivivax sp.]